MNKLLNRANKRVSLGGAASLLIVVALIGQGLGFLRNRLISTNFTVLDPGSSDAFFAAFQIPDFFYFTIAAGALGVAFMPILADRLQTGDKKSAWEMTNSLLNTLIIVMTVVAVIIFAFAKPLIHTLAPNLPQDHLDQAVLMMRIISINPLLFTVSGIVTSMQQTFGRFFFFAMAPLTYNMVIILSIYIFRDNIGIVGLAVGAVAGAVIQMVVAWFGMIGLGFKWRPEIIWRNNDYRKVLHQLPPRSLDQGIDQVNSIVEVNRAQALGVGAVSYYNYALTLHYVPIMLIGNTISTAAFPRLVDRLAQGRPDLFRRDFLKILTTMIWLSTPVVIIAYFARGYLARIIFGQAAPEVALIFGYLTLAIFFRTIFTLVSRYFYAHKDTKTPLFVSIFAIGLNIYLAFRLAHPDSYGITGLALAQSIVAVTEVAILGVIMIYRDFRLLDREFIGNQLKIASVAGFAVLAAFFMISILPLKISDFGFVTLGTKLLLITLVTFSTYIGVSWLFGLEEARISLAKIKKVILSPIRLS